MQNINDLLQIFPNATVCDSPNTQDGMLNFQFKTKWLVLKGENLTETEIKLLQVISERTLNKENSHHAWYQYLLNQTKIPQVPSDAFIRIIQFNIMPHDPSITVQKWLNTLKTIYQGDLLDAFLISNHRGIVIEKFNTIPKEPVEDLIETCQALDNDLYCSTKYFIGQCWNAKKPINLLFSQEKNFFEFQIEQNSAQNYFDTPNTILSYYFKHSLSHDPLIHHNEETLKEMPDAKKTITTLYQNGGNISTTAKKLFLHRNTLQYRIKKFQEVTTFNLKNMDDLLFCYLLTLLN